MIYVLGFIIIISIVILLVINNKTKEEIDEKAEKIEKDIYAGLAYEDDNIDYRTYQLTSGDKIKYMLIGYAVVFAVSYVFYASLFLSLIAGLLGLLYIRFQKDYLLRKRQDKLTIEFKDALYSIYTSLSAGESPENALKQVPDDLKELYVEEETYIIPEFEIIARRLGLNLSIEEVLDNFASRTGVEDIENFADIFITSIDTGSKQSEIIKSSINTIVEKIEIKREIELMISAKKFEARIMSFMPIFIILFLSLVAKDYFMPMYNTIFGRSVMTIVIVGLFVADKISTRIMKIEV